jgi:hypothetical protein
MEITKNIVKRANETIGIVPSGNHRLTNLVRKLYSVILLFSQMQGDKEEYRAVLSDMLKAANSSGSNRVQVKAILRDIRSIGVDWNVREGDREIWKNVGLIEEPGLIDGKGTPTIVTWKLPKIIRNRLLDPNGFFTRISLQIMTQLKSGASIALYEICCQYASNDHGKGEGGLTFKGSLENWIPRIVGTRKSAYEYKFFKRDVLLPAIKEIQEITNLSIEIIEHKKGRKVTELQFRVFQNKGDLTIGLAKDPGIKSKFIDATVQLFKYAERVESLGLSKTMAEKICQEYSDKEEYLLKAIELVEARDKNTSIAPLRSKAAFFKQALKEGYAYISPAPTMVQTKPLVSAKSVELLEETQIRQKMVAEKEEIWRRYQSLTNEETKKMLFEEFLSNANSAVVSFVKKGGINNMIVKTSFIEWLLIVKNF